MTDREVEIEEMFSEVQARHDRTNCLKSNELDFIDGASRQDYDLTQNQYEWLKEIFNRVTDEGHR